MSGLCRAGNGIASYSGLKTEKEKFAGALRSYTLEAMMQDGRASRPLPRTTWVKTSPKHLTSPSPTNTNPVCLDNELGHQHASDGALIMAHSDDEGW